METTEPPKVDETAAAETDVEPRPEQQPITGAPAPEPADTSLPSQDAPSLERDLLADEVPAPSDDASLQDVPGAMASLGKEVSDLAGLIRERSRSDEVTREAFERLHSEMRGYKDNFLQKALEPMYKSLVGLADSMDKVIADGGEDTESVRFLRDELLEVLNRYGIEPFAAEAPAFDPSTQKAVATTQTDQEVLHRCVVERVHPGYRTEERVIRPEHVTIYVYKPTPPSTQERESNE